jgi:hypothetical protein
MTGSMVTDKIITKKINCDKGGAKRKLQQVHTDNYVLIILN